LAEEGAAGGFNRTGPTTIPAIRGGADKGTVGIGRSDERRSRPNVGAGFRVGGRGGCLAGEVRISPFRERGRRAALYVFKSVLEKAAGSAAMKAPASAGAKRGACFDRPRSRYDRGGRLATGRNRQGSVGFAFSGIVDRAVTGQMTSSSGAKRRWC